MSEEKTLLLGKHEFIPDPPLPTAATDASPPPPTDDLVEAWYAETFHNLALPTELQNRFRAAADELKARLRQKEQ